MISIHILFGDKTIFFKAGKYDRAGFISGIAAARLGLPLGDQYHLIFNSRTLAADVLMKEFHEIQVEMIATGELT